ncbi:MULTISPECIES: FmdB family zinc ribbon protein [Desulfotignum]|uniref:FmdB family zinc ribbon protein n=1 Tax=Desulfotignum TaxID=115780 RepID=UPI00034CA566|nr:MULTISPECIES: zinc ribbon domain-containing protein [Desulfotignum]
MPLFDFLCNDCGKTCELLMIGTGDEPKCTACGSSNLSKQMSAHSAMSGPAKFRTPGPGDTACCGAAPGQASGCAGPGTCCGKAF